MDGRHFVEAYLDTQPNRLGADFREALFDRTGGHALFTVELVRELQERGDVRQDADGQWIDGPAIDWNTLPARVEGAIEKRIQRLDKVRRYFTVSVMQPALSYPSRLLALPVRLPAGSPRPPASQSAQRSFHSGAADFCPCGCRD